MTTLIFEPFSILGADVGELNCLPDMGTNGYIHAKITVSPDVPADLAENIGSGMIRTLLPYQRQSCYTREKKPLTFQSAVLENEYLKAVFIPELGGRLWSLYHKKEKRELLYCNSVFRPANLALRNAWFSGGVEWNVGIKGHNPLTCSPMFACEAVNAAGEPLLTMYEYERIRGVVYTVTAALKQDTLLIKTTVENPADRDTYMYWWSNIAVPETPHTRVIAPADEALAASYNKGSYSLDFMALPCLDGDDITYPANLKRCRDFFFRIPKQQAKWIAAVDGDGKGLLQYSTANMTGRKLFAWGQTTGGRHWNRWLSDDGGPYVEIQAGLLPTQLEHFVMPGNSTLTFYEGYGMIVGDPARLHAPDYRTAVEEVQRSLVTKPALDSLDVFHTVAVQPPRYYGSGWGALEELSRGKRLSTALVFPADSMGPEQQYWNELLSGGKTHVPDPDRPILSFMTGEDWIERLRRRSDKDWYDWMQLGVLYYAQNDLRRAADCFTTSLAQTENAWSCRNLAQLKRNFEGDKDGAADLMKRAVSCKKDYLPLLIDCAETLIDAGRYTDWINLVDTLPDWLRENGRLMLFTALCYSKLGQNETAEQMLEGLTVADICEGESSLTDLWMELHKRKMPVCDGAASVTLEQVLRQYPLPYHLDFRMH